MCKDRRERENFDVTAEFCDDNVASIFPSSREGPPWGKADVFLCGDRERSVSRHPIPSHPIYKVDRRRKLANCEGGGGGGAEWRNAVNLVWNNSDNRRRKASRREGIHIGR